MIQLAKRLSTFSESATLAMTQKSRELKAQGYDIINLSIGEPDFNTPDFIKQAAKKALEDNFTFYPPVSGYADLREAISLKFKRDNNIDYAPDEIVVSTGAKQSLTNALMCLVDPDDEVIVPTPYWVSYTEMIKLASGKAVFIHSSIDTDFKVTPQQIEDAITPKSKVFIFSSPCNPSGSVYTRAELEAFARIFEKHPNIYIISDEIYEHINFNGHHESIAQFDFIKDRVITINGVSKGFAMTGWRLGYMGAHKQIAKACDKFQGQITSATCSIAQKATIAAMLSNPKDNQDLIRMRNAFRERRDLVLSLMNEISGIKTNVPLGAFYVFADITAFFGKKSKDFKINNANDFCMYLLNKAHVATVPGEAFGNDDCFRISYATSNDLLIEAIKRIKQALQELN